MKNRTLLLAGLVAALTLNGFSQASDAPPPSTLSEVGTSIGTTVAAFFAGNPTNSWDVSAYGVCNTKSTLQDVAKGWGAGARVGYWLNPSVGASIDLSYCDSSWTFASIGLAGRGTIKLGSIGTVSPYITAGPGVNIKSSASGVEPTIVVVAGGGATLHFDKLKWCDFFGEYRHVTTTEAQDLITFGIVKKF
jgi:hypothetical protein